MFFLCGYWKILTCTSSLRCISIGQHLYREERFLNELKEKLIKSFCCYYPCWKGFQVGLGYAEKLVSRWSFIRKMTVSVCRSQPLTSHFAACDLLCLTPIRCSTYMCWIDNDLQLYFTDLWIRNFEFCLQLYHKLAL